MHELSIAQSIMEIALDQMKTHGMSKIETILLRVGALQGVVEDCLSFGFDLLARETPLQGARLVFEKIPIRGRCLTCGQEFTMGHWIDDCPFCSTSRVEVTSGKELEIVQIEGT